MVWLQASGLKKKIVSKTKKPIFIYDLFLAQFVRSVIFFWPGFSSRNKEQKEIALVHRTSRAGIELTN